MAWQLRGSSWPRRSRPPATTTSARTRRGEAAGNCTRPRGRCPPPPPPRRPLPAIPARSCAESPATVPRARSCDARRDFLLLGLILRRGHGECVRFSPSQPPCDAQTLKRASRSASLKDPDVFHAQMSPPEPQVTCSLVYFCAAPRAVYTLQPTCLCLPSARKKGVSRWPALSISSGPVSIPVPSWTGANTGLRRGRTFPKPPCAVSGRTEHLLSTYCLTGVGLGRFP